LNSGKNDVSTAIDSYIDVELNYHGQYMALTELVIRCKTQSAGNITVTAYKNTILKWTLALSMVAEIANQGVRRHCKSVNLLDQHITLRLENGTASQDMFLQELGLGVQIWEGR